MRITLDINKSVEENAGIYFEKAKKQKKKLEGALKAIEVTKKKIENLDKKKNVSAKNKVEKKKRKKEWYEKFHWFFSSEGFLVIGGRDSTTNELVIKKHTDANDVVFHTDMAGSPFFVIKCEGKKPGKETLDESAHATASYSRAWGKGLSSVNVFHVRPDQVSKTPKPGEYLEKGAFIISGKVEYIRAEIRLGIGIKDGVIIGGPIGAVKKNSEKYFIVEQGDDKKSDVAKKLKKELNGDLEEIMHMLPAGNCRIKRN